MRAGNACLVMVMLALLAWGCAQAKFPPHYTLQGNYTFFYDPDTRARNPEVYFGSEFSNATNRLKARNAAAWAGGNSTRYEQRRAMAIERDIKGRTLPPWMGGNETRPEVLIGVGLSGGGIRSNAFQLGLLSGLQNMKDAAFSHNGTDSSVSLLDNVSYLSAVSGGSWAMGAFAANATDAEPEAFFKALDKTVLTRTVDEGCDDSERKSSLCRCKNKMLCVLNNSYVPVQPAAVKSNILTDPFGLHAGYYVRNAWRDMLFEFNLVRNDFRLSDLANNSRTPYLIFNPTHSAGGVGQGWRHFPFQVTPQGVGTIADCGNTDYCGDYGSHAGFFKTFDNSFPSVTLSQAMAMAGAVAPESFFGIRLNLMEWTLNMPEGGWSDKDAKPASETSFREESTSMCEKGYGKKTFESMWPFDASKEIFEGQEKLCGPIKHPKGKAVQRSRYILGDGGHSENFGALALLERGVDLLIISDGGLDAAFHFEDWGILKRHAKLLLKQDITLFPEADIESPLSWLRGDDLSTLSDLGPSKDQLEKTTGDIPKSVEQNEVARYVRHKLDTRNATELVDNVILGHVRNMVDQPKAAQHVIFVRPAYNYEAKFMAHLQKKATEAMNTGKGGISSGYVHTYRYLTNNPGRFPCDKTLAFSYDRELIYAYYLYGKFIAEKELGDLVKQYLLHKLGKLGKE